MFQRVDGLLVLIAITGIDRGTVLHAQRYGEDSTNVRLYYVCATAYQSMSRKVSYSIRRESGGQSITQNEIARHQSNEMYNRKGDNSGTMR